MHLLPVVINYLLILGCFGYEPTVQRCQWHRRKMGSGVCDHHPNLGLRCLPFHHRENRAADRHWRGLRFESAPFKKELLSDNTLYVSKSRSILSHVQVLGAGRGFWKGKANATSAIETWGVPPVMEHILVENSAYNGKYKQGIYEVHQCRKRAC